MTNTPYLGEISRIPTVPEAGQASSIAVGGTAVTVFAAGAIVNGADIVNPPDATGQGIATAETLYVDIVATASAGAATSVPLLPGAAFHIGAPIQTPVTVVAATAGHRFVAVGY